MHAGRSGFASACGSGEVVGSGPDSGHQGAPGVAFEGQYGSVRMFGVTYGHQPVGPGHLDAVAFVATAKLADVTSQALPDGDDHQVIRLGDETAVVVPLEEYRLLRLTHDWHHGQGRVRTSPQEFLAISGLSDEDQRLLSDRYGLAAGQP
jgi:hypothetical protein